MFVLTQCSARIWGWLIFRPSLWHRDTDWRDSMSAPCLSFSVYWPTCIILRCKLCMTSCRLAMSGTLACLHAGLTNVRFTSFLSMLRVLQCIFSPSYAKWDCDFGVSESKSHCMDLFRLRDREPPHTFHFYAESPQFDLSWRGTRNVAHTQGLIYLFLSPPFLLTVIVDVRRWMHPLVTACSRIAHPPSWPANNSWKDRLVSCHHLYLYMNHS